MKLTIKHKPCGLVDFYDAVAREMGCADKATNYDCTKIDIAPNIQDGFYEFYSNSAKANGVPESEITVGITMLLAMSGPKVNRDLKANEVEVYDGFIC